MKGVGERGRRCIVRNFWIMHNAPPTLFTQNVIKQERKKGAKKLLVFVPSFVADCLETIYEIGMEYREEFLTLGGEALDLVPSLNSSPAWRDALTEIIKEKIPEK